MSVYNIYDSLQINKDPIGNGLFINGGGSSIAKSVPNSATTWRFDTITSQSFFIDQSLDSSQPVQFLNLTAQDKMQVTTFELLRGTQTNSTLNITTTNLPVSAYNQMSAPFTPTTGTNIELFRINMSPNSTYLVTTNAAFKSPNGTIVVGTPGGAIFVSFLVSNQSGSIVTTFFNLFQNTGGLYPATIFTVANPDGSFSIVGNASGTAIVGRTTDTWSAMIDIIPI